MADCVICGHPQREHYQDGCHRQRWPSARCACTYVEQAPLPPAAVASDHRARADWWDGQARRAWSLMTMSRDDLRRWHRLDRFHRAARQADIEHRRRAEELQRSQPPPVVVVVVAPAYETVPVAGDGFEPTLGGRLSVGAPARSRFNAA